jgi:hypothetical protein
MPKSVCCEMLWNFVKCEILWNVVECEKWNVVNVVECCEMLRNVKFCEMLWNFVECCGMWWNVKCCEMWNVVKCCEILKDRSGVFKNPYARFFHVIWSISQKECTTLSVSANCYARLLNVCPINLWTLSSKLLYRYNNFNCSSIS